MAQRRLGQTDGGRTHFDAHTGELLEEGYTAYVVPKRKNGFGTRWAAVAQDAIKIFAKSSDLCGDDLRVLLMLLGELDFENQLIINQAEIARELGIHRQTVQRSIKRLISMGALLEGPRVGVSRSYRFDPNFGWKGSAKNHVIALEAERKRRMKDAGITGVLKGQKDTPPKDAKEPERDTRTIDMFEDDAGV